MPALSALKPEARHAQMGSKGVSNMRVVLFTRKPRRCGNYSVELIVESLIRELGDDLRINVAKSHFESSGVLPRLYCMIEAALRQGDVNHVTGDVNFLTCFLRKKRTLLTVLDCGRIEGKPDLRKRIIRLIWFDIPVRRCAAVTVISQYTKRQLLQHVSVDPGRIHVVPVAVPAHFHRIDKSFNTAKPVVLQVGTAKNKNLARLFLALRDIPCELHVVGALNEDDCRWLNSSGLQYRLFRNLTNEQMLQRYAACDLVAFASTYEGFGMPIVEANVVGRPVVTSNTASMPEVAGNAACLVDPFRVESIRTGLLRVIRDHEYRETLVRNGYINARRFDEKVVAGQYEALYRMLGGEPWV